MRILFLGDVVGRSGRDAVVAALPRLRADLRVDLGDGERRERLARVRARHPTWRAALFAAGADAITLGNHAWDRKEIIPYHRRDAAAAPAAEYPAGYAGRRHRGGGAARRAPGAGAAGDGAAVHGRAGLPVPRHRGRSWRGTGWAGTVAGRGDRTSTPRRRARRWRSGIRSTGRRQPDRRHPYAHCHLRRRPDPAGRHRVSSRTPACAATMTA